MIVLHGITKRFRTKTVETTALDNVSVTIEKSEFVAIVGPSGCGKSTLLGILGLLSRPDQGEISIFGKQVAYTSERNRAIVRRDHIGMIFQSFNLLEELTVQENVELALLYQGVTASKRSESVKKTLDRLGILHRAEHYPMQLSGGQQQRVAIARAIISRPEILLADEPTGNLDEENGAHILNELHRLNSDGTTIAMVTHSRRDAERASRIIRLDEGRVCDSHQ